jgi:hypothetical protein
VCSGALIGAESWSVTKNFRALQERRWHNAACEQVLS